jgi:gluconolactonase
VDRGSRVLHLPEVVSNLTFGGPKRNDLYITATSSVYSVRLNTTGARYPAGAR